MKAILDLTLAGRNLSPGPIEEQHVLEIAGELEARLIEQGRTWADVSLRKGSVRPQWGAGQLS